jgi:DeoR/GlpR family transcriptional regulator of sugar metabolism
MWSKYAIALRAVALLEEGDSLLIDAGTSLTPIAKLIRRMADTMTQQTHYTVMTHNNEAFNALSDTPPDARFNVFQTGGRYDRDLNASFGHQAEMAYLRFHPRWVFIGQNGLEADLGLFCHGNTEELALKREIFAMPAWGRVVISDFTKIGSPGGLLFGDSANLITNVDHCIVLSDDIHDEKFKGCMKGDEGQRAFERFEAQIRELQETYQVAPELVHYAVIQGRYPKGELATRMPVDLEDEKFIPNPDTHLDEQLQSHATLTDRVYRVYCTDKDLNRNAKLRPGSSPESNAWGYVDISFKGAGTSLVVTVENLHFFKKP